MKARTLLIFFIVPQILYFGAASTCGQNLPLLSAQSSDASLYDARLIATVTTGSNSTAAWFEWGLDTNYGQLTPAIIRQGVTALSFSNFIAGLNPYTTYHFQAVASNAFGTVYGGDTNFTTVPRFVRYASTPFSTPPIMIMSSAAMSSNGQHFAATINVGVSISTNLGVTFLYAGTSGKVFAISGNGATILAFAGINICVSLNQGLTWITNTAPEAISYAAASDNGQNIVAANGTSNIFTSGDFGATWTTSVMPESITCVASSVDGSQVYAGAAIPYPGAQIPTYVTPGAWVYGSKDSGGTWTTLGTFASSIGMYGIACSADGHIVAAASDAVFISTNGGVSWGAGPPTNSVTGGYAIACSGDGRTILDVPRGFRSTLMISPDTGTDWYPIKAFEVVGASGEFTKLMCSQDGQTLAVQNPGGLYVTLPPPSEPFVFSSVIAEFNGVTSFQLTGPVGYSCWIQSSTNLINWSDIAGLVNTNGAFSFTDSRANNDSHRFYRAIVP